MAIIIGTNGDDMLIGGAEADSLWGLNGNDTYVVSTGDTVVENAAEGTDLVISDVSFTLGANVENLLLTGAGPIDGTGNSLNNSLTGNSAANVLTGGVGADTMLGGAGDDTYVVDQAGDVVTEQANEGVDTVRSAVSFTIGATIENLTLTGSAWINGTGNELNNILTGNFGMNVLTGGAGNDTYFVGVSDSVVVENANEGTDLVVSTTVSWTLGANIENLTLTGDFRPINGTGNELNNILIGNFGPNVLTGGAGNDTYYVGARDSVVENVNEGTDLVVSDVTWTLGANLEYLTLTGTGAINGTGNSLNNILTGNSGANVLDGGLGVDALVGGTGSDTYLVDNGSDVVTEQVNEGADTVQSSVTYTLIANVENLTLIGTTAINGTGNELRNVLRGNSGANVLTGGVGHDTYVVSTGDTVVENATEGTDVVLSDVTWTLGANLEYLTLSGTGAINGTGNSLNNTLTGNSGANVLTGGAGNDTYYVGAGDMMVEFATGGTDLVVSGVSWALGANLENLTLSGTGAINGTGNSLNNTLRGNSAANILDGGLGVDVLVGGTGGDTYLVDNGSDVVTEQVNEGADTVQSSVTYTLVANVENLTLIGTASINGIGNNLNNTLRGNSEANVLSGGMGNDTYVVSTGDTVVENATEGTDLVMSDVTWTLGANLEYLTLTGTGAINGTGNSLNNTLRGNSAANVLTGGAGHDTYYVGAGDSVVENANEGTDVVVSDVTWTLGANLEYLTLSGTGAINGTGNSLNNTLTGNSTANVLTGGSGNDTLAGGLANDTYRIDRGAGQDRISEDDGTVGNSDRLLYGATINPLDLVLSRQVNDLRLAIHGSTDFVTIQNWFSAPTTAQVETIQAGNGQTLLSTQVDQLIQAMAGFTQQTGLTWDQAIDQQPQNVQTVLAASWQ
jgi:trimeric autotransporter adhesin